MWWGDYICTVLSTRTALSVKTIHNKFSFIMNSLTSVTYGWNPACKWQNWDSNPGLSWSKPKLLGATVPLNLTLLWVSGLLAADHPWNLPLLYHDDSVTGLSLLPDPSTPTLPVFSPAGSLLCSPQTHLYYTEFSFICHSGHPLNTSRPPGH